MKRLVSLMLSIVLVLTMVAPAMAAFTPGAIITEVRLMEAGGKLSNDLITQAIIDLSNMENHGTVSATVYASVYENQTVNNYTDILRQPPADGTIKLTHFIFELTNQYRLQDTDLMLSVSPDRRTVQTYVYGQYKDQAMYSVLTGIPDCLNNEPYSRPPSSSKSSGGSSWIDPYSPEEIGKDPIKSFQVTTFAIDEKTYTVAPSATAAEGEVVAPTVQTMDVAPYIKEDRTYVPVRYLAYSLGVAEDDVTWDGDARKVGISKDNTDIALVIGSPVMFVNGQSTRMDVSPEITNDRTFLPARWVAEALGAEVEWDDTSREAIIKMPITEPGN
jgi:hypothetical protein